MCLDLYFCVEWQDKSLPFLNTNSKRSCRRLTFSSVERRTTLRCWQYLTWQQVISQGVCKVPTHVLTIIIIRDTWLLVFIAFYCVQFATDNVWFVWGQLKGVLSLARGSEHLICFCSLKGRHYAGHMKLKLSLTLCFAKRCFAGRFIQVSLRVNNWLALCGIVSQRLTVCQRLTVLSQMGLHAERKKKKTER